MNNGETAPLPFSDIQLKEEGLAKISQTGLRLKPGLYAKPDGRP